MAEYRRKRLARVLSVVTRAMVCLVVVAFAACGKKSSGPRLFVLGLDGATFDLLQPWLDAGDLPVLKGLMDTGVHGELRSVYPILSPVAWTTAATGVNPGKHGIFDFERPDPNTPGKGILYTALERRSMPVWSLLSEAGKSVGVLNVPMTWPPDKVNGVMISGFPFPADANLEYTHPKELQATLVDYPLDVMGEALVKGAEGAKLADLVHSRDSVTNILLDWMKNRNDDFTWAVITATDRMQHFFWGMMDPKHPYHTEQLGRDYGDSIREFWVAMDRRLGEIVAALPPDATLMIISDHGFGPIYREVNTMNWFYGSPLIDFMKNNTVPDFYITNGIFRYRTGGDGQPGKPPGGPVYEEFAAMYQKEAGAITDPQNGRHPVERVMRRTELYSGRMTDKGPDLLMIEAPEYYIGTGDTSKDLEPVSDLHSTSYSAYHRPNGVIIMKGPNVRTGQLVGASLLDVTPTILHILGQPVPTEMDGRVLEAVFTPDWLTAHKPAYTDGVKVVFDRPDRVLSPEESEALKAIPYIQ